MTDEQLLKCRSVFKQLLRFCSKLEILLNFTLDYKEKQSQVIAEGSYISQLLYVY